MRASCPGLGEVVWPDGMWIGEGQLDGAWPLAHSRYLLAQARQKSSQSKAGAADPSELTVTWDWSSNARATVC